MLIFSALKSTANGIDSIAILKKKVETLGDTKEKAQTLYTISRWLNKVSDVEALAYANRSLELAKHIGDKKAQADAANLIGKVYYEYGDLNLSLSHYLFAMRMYKELGHWKGYITTLNNVGTVQSSLKNPDKAYWYFYRALLLNKNLGDSNGISSNLNNIGTVLLDKNRAEEALSYFKQAYVMDTLAAIKDTYRISIRLTNIAEAYEKLKDYNKALIYSYENIRMAQHAGMFYNLELAYTTTGGIYIKMQDFERAKKYCLLALDLAKKHKLRDEQASVYQKLSMISEATGNTKQALSYHQTYHSLYDSLYNEKNTKQIHQMEAIYESSLKDEQIKSLNKDKEIAFSRANSERLFTNFILVISLLMIIMGLTLARNLVLKHRKRLSEEKAIAEIEKKRFERDNAKLMHENVSAKYEVLKSKINPHFLFNSLAALSSIMPEGAHQAEEFIDNFSDFYRKIIETGDVELLPLKEEINIVETYLYLQQIAVGKNLIVDIRIAQHCVELLVPPFAVQMVVENAIKHNEISSINPLKISIFTKENSLVITNTIRRRTNEPPSTGIGEKNIIARYKLFSAKTPDFRDMITDYIVTLPLLKKKNTNNQGVRI